MKTQRTADRRPTLNVQALEDRCTPATFAYAAATQTLTLFGANNDQLDIVATAGDPIGYISVTESAIPVFTSADAARPVRNLVVRFDAVNVGSLTVFSSVRLGGNLNVFGAKSSMTTSSAAKIGGNVNYKGAAAGFDDLTFTASTFIAGNMSLALGGGLNQLFLHGGTVGGNMTVVGGKHPDYVQLASIVDLSVGGAATFLLGDATNKIDGMAAHRFAVGKSLTYKGGPWVDNIDLATMGTDLSVGGNVSFNMGNAAANFQKFLKFDDIHVGGNLAVVGGNHKDTVLVYGDLSVGGNVTFDLKDSLNLLDLSNLGTSANTIGGNLTYKGGLNLDQVYLDGTTIGKNVAVALGATPNNLQRIWVGTEDTAGVRVYGSFAITGGVGMDDIRLSRLYVGNILTINAGGEFDTVRLNDVDVAGVTLIDLGAGNDKLYVETDASDGAGNLTADTSFGGKFTVRGGAGDDTVNLSDDGDATTLARFGAKAALLGGEGADTLNNAGNEFILLSNFEDFDAGDSLP